MEASVGPPPQHYAANTASVEAARCLLEAGGGWSARDAAGRTPSDVAPSEAVRFQLSAVQITVERQLRQQPLGDPRRTTVPERYRCATSLWEGAL
jgi:hypothetical protein